MKQPAKLVHFRGYRIPEDNAYRAICTEHAEEEDSTSLPRRVTCTLCQAILVWRAKGGNQ